MSEYNPFEHPTILIVGGWYGSYLLPMLQAHLNPYVIYHTDKDPDVIQQASILHAQRKQCVFQTLDADAPQQLYKADILINTSCEHMHTIGDAAIDNPNCLYVLQSCDNANDPGHINTSRSTDEFVESTGLTEILFRGRLSLGHKNRFIVMGYK